MKPTHPTLATKVPPRYANDMNGLINQIDPVEMPPGLPWAAEDGPICRSIRQDILSGRISSNERLKVSDLAAQYGTSTNPVREALHQLRGEGLRAAADWIEHYRKFWEASFDRLDAFLKSTESESKPTKGKSHARRKAR